MVKLRVKPQTLYILTAIMEDKRRVPIERFTVEKLAQEALAALNKEAAESTVKIPGVARYEVFKRLTSL